MKGRNILKEELMQMLSVTLNALNGVSVAGKQNLANLSGSISMIEKVMERIANSTFTEATED